MTNDFRPHDHKTIQITFKEQKSLVIDIGHYTLYSLLVTHYSEYKHPSNGSYILVLFNKEIVVCCMR